MPLAIHGTLKRRVCSPRIINVTLALAVQVYGFPPVTDSQRHPCSPHLSLEEKENLFLNWFALCHCHRYVFPVLTGSCNSISNPSTFLWNRSVLGWLGLLKLVDLLLLHVFRERKHVHAHKWAEESRVGEERERKRDTPLSPQSIKYLNNVWKWVIFNCTVGCLHGKWAVTFCQ